MADPVGTYLTVLFIGIGLTVVVGLILMRSVRPFLEDIFERPETAASVTRLIVVLFHLIVLGLVALVASIGLTLGDPLQTVVVRIGLVLLVLGAAHGATLLVLARLRARRRVQGLLTAQEAQAEQARVAGQPYPVVEPGHGR
ncbi:MAG TPA: hypothetical protein VFQ77_16005 [Pseudonocardiaceae bacterium]|nr:hypothetical protein [Pseudonocardiaceae bacterium]